MEIVQHSFLDSKTCARCGTLKPLYEFSPRSKGSADGYRQICKACQAAQSQKWRDAHPEHRERKNKRQREWVAKNREEFNARRRAYHKDYYQRNQDRLRIVNAENQRHWRQTNPALVRADRQAQRARSRYKDGSASFKASEWLALCAHYGNRCLRCGQALPLTPDHIVPVSQGGSNTIDNIQPLCHLCNSQKGAGTTDYRY